MTREELIKNIYSYGLNLRLRLNIKRNGYTIRDLWNINDGILVSIITKNSIKSKYVDNLNLTDKMLVHNKLLRIDIYKNIKECYPHLRPKELMELTNKIYTDIRHKRRVFHRKG